MLNGLPSIVTCFKSPLVNNKSPCSTPSIPKSFKCSKDVFNLLRKPALLTGSSFLVVSG